MFGNKREKIIKRLNKLDFDKLDPSSIHDLKIAFNELFEGHDDRRILDMRYAYDIVENSNVVVFEWTLDLNTPTKYVSDNITQFGYVPEDFYSGDFTDYWNFVHPDDREEIKKSLREAREKGKLYNHTYRILTKTGEVRWVEERIIYEKNSDGELVHEKGILIDVTETKKLQEEVERSKERYQRIFENSSVIIFTVKLDGQINAINKMFKRTLGYQDEDIKNVFVKDFLVSPEEIDSILNYSKRDIEDSFDIEFYCKDRQIKTLNVSTNIIDSYEEEIEIVAVDVSEKKIDEQKIRYLSYHDKLTNVYNRAYFDEMVHQLDHEKRYPFSIIIGDMNGLKELNDNFGHKSGDKVLQDVAEICVASCRDHDIVCRIGGDEFAIVCPDTDESGARSICKRIRSLCLERTIEPLGNPSIALGFSTKQSEDEYTDQIIKMADDNMYRNKMTSKKSTSGMYIGALQTMLGKSSFETKDHTIRVQQLATKLGEHMKLPEDQIDDLELVALMHDIGKVGIPNDILSKSGPLTTEEFETVKGHSYIGSSILETVPATHQIAEYILYHHEHFDGSGYPEGLKGHAIPLISRIVNIIDAYDVMLQGTVYQDKKTQDETIEELKSCSGTQFDPEVLEVFLEMIR